MRKVGVGAEKSPQKMETEELEKRVLALEKELSESHEKNKKLEKVNKTVTK